MKLKSLAPAVLLFVFTACKKDKTTPTSCDKTMAAIAGTYIVSKIELGTGGVFSDITSQMKDCQKDDKLTLNSNGTSTYQDLGIACSPSGNGSGTWSIDASGKMTIDGGGGPARVSQADINSFDCTALVVTGTTSSAPGFDFRVTLKK
jgi:Lipocalin-like domain